MADKMRIIYIIFMACLCVACGNNPGNDKVESEPISIVAKPIMDSMLNVGVSEIIEDGQSWVEYKSPPPPISESCLVIVFEIDPEMKRMYFSDSTVYISHKVCERTYPLEAYKGVLSVDSCRVAVFDKYGIGDRYYNSDSLKMIPFDEFKCFPMKIAPAARYYIKNNYLHYWNP